MKILKSAIVIFFILLISFVYYTLSSSGFFRTIKPKFEGRILKEIKLKGAEDITISLSDSFALVSATNRLSYPKTSEERGGLYFIDLKTETLNPILLTEDFEGSFAPHGISIFKLDSIYQVMAINHTNQGHSIEVFELDGKTLSHKKTLQDQSMIRPNDLVIVDKDKFYFTNDHRYTKGLGKFVEEYGGLAISNVVYFDTDNYREVAKGIAYANGINVDQERNLLFVASPRKFLIKVFEIQEDASLSFVENIPCKTGVDNIEFDENASLWVGCHPNLLHFSAYGKGKKDLSPSEIIKIDYRSKGDYSVEKVYVDEGQKMSASTVAAPFGRLIFMGNILDTKFLVLERN